MVRLAAGRARPSRGDDEAIFLPWKVRHFFRQKMNEKPFQIDDPTTPAVSPRTYRPPT
jgi:hypothetical protein